MLPDKLRIGDIITLRQPKPNDGWLYSEGIIDNDCQLRKENYIFEESLWQITIQYQYRSICEYDEALMRYHENLQNNIPENPEEKQERESKLAQLKRAALNEQRLNKKLMEMKMGKPVAFGDVIQLLHVKSQTFLTISPHTLAKQERENFRVFLKENGDPLSWLEFMPRFKYDKEGQQIVHENECHIRVHERPSEFVHAARKVSKFSANGNREINCSLENSVWTISIYQQCWETKSKNILCGQLVLLQGVETSTFITLSEQCPGKTESADLIMSNPILLSISSSDGQVGTNLLWMVESEDPSTGGVVSQQGKKIALRDLTSGLYMKMNSNGTLSAVRQRDYCSFFEFSTAHLLDSDVGLVEGSLVHLSSENKYISLGQAENVEMKCYGVSDRTFAVSIVVSSKLTQHLGPQVFGCGDATRILRKFYILSKNSDHSQLSTSLIDSELRAVAAALDYLIAFLATDNDNYSDTYGWTAQSFDHGQLKAVVEHSATVVLLTRQTIVREQGVLDVILDLLELINNSSDERSDDGSTLIRSILSENSDRTESFRGGSIKRSAKGSGLLKVKSEEFRNTDSKGPPGGTFASLCLCAIFYSIKSNPVNQIHVANRFAVLLTQVKTQEMAVSCVQELLRENLQILQTKVGADEINIFLDLLEESPINVTLLRLLRSTCSCPTGVDNTQRLISMSLFANSKESLIRSMNRRSKLVRSLTTGENFDIDRRLSSQDIPQSTSKKNRTITWSESSPMQGFDLQETVANKPQHIQSRSHLIIKLKPVYDDAHLRKMNWSEKYLYLPRDESELQQVLGISLLREGIHPLVVSWNIPMDFEFNMKTLFGSSNDIPLDQLTSLMPRDAILSVRGKLRSTQRMETPSPFSPQQSFSGNPRKPPMPLSPAQITRQSMKQVVALKKQNSRIRQKTTQSYTKSIFERKLQIAEYFIAQLYLAADLCLDRNYVAIGLLEEMYSVETLLALFRSSATPNRWKAAICKLIRTLYVDREPQTPAQFPRLVKTSKSLHGESEDCFADYHSGSQYRFAILQQMISDYLQNDFDCNKCDDLSAEIMDLLYALISFGFYYSFDHLYDITVPLIQGLEKRIDSERKSNQVAQRRRSSLLYWSRRFSDQSSQPVNLSERDLLRQTSFGSFRNSLTGLQVDQKDSLLQSFFKFFDFDDHSQWQAVLLQKLESIHTLIIILTLVIFVTTYSLIEVIHNKQPSNVFKIVDFTVSILFISELTVRMYCYAVVNKGIISFFAFPLNILDVFVVLLDVVLLSIGSQIGQAASFAKTIRVLRLIRIFRAARLLKRIAEVRKSHRDWIMPMRYREANDHEIRTIAGILKILAEVHARIQDRKLTCCIKTFVQWNEAEMTGKPINPNEILKKLLSFEQSLTDIVSRRFDRMLMDVAMYSDPHLVKEALNILLLFKRQDQLLHESLRNIQLISTPKMELVYGNVAKWLKTLTRMAEAFEVWSGLKSEDEIAVAQTAENTLGEMFDVLTAKPPSKEFEMFGVFYVNTEIQQLLLNLNALSTFMTLQKALLDPSLGHPRYEIKRIIIACNNLISEFVRGNEKNQELTFRYLDWFLEGVDLGVNSSKVVRSILSGNDFLIKQCQRKYLAEFMQKIFLNGRLPEYLDLFVGMTEVTDITDTGVSVLHNDIARYVTSSERSSYLLLWCCSPDSIEYSERLEAMKPYHPTNNRGSIVPEYQLSPDLRYHINLLVLLSGCNLGPKLHAVYPLDSIVPAILDENTIPHVRNALMKVVSQITTVQIEGISASESMWQLFEYMIGELETMSASLYDMIVRPEKMMDLHIHKVWLRLTITIIQTFFQGFTFEDFEESASFSEEESYLLITKRSDDDIKPIIDDLFSTIKAFRNKHLAIMTKNTINEFDETLIYWHDVSNDIPRSSGPAIATLKEKRRSQAERRASLQADVQQVYFRKQYHIFLDKIKSVNYSHNDIGTENHSIELIEQLDLVYDTSSESDIRLEPFILKISSHLRNEIQRTTSARNLESSSVNTAIWILSTFRHILEKNTNLNIWSISDASNETEVYETSYFHEVLDEYGVTYLCLDLIAPGIEPSLCLEAMKLLILLLNKSDGNLKVQKNIHLYLSSVDSTLFFEQLRDYLEHIRLWCQKEEENTIINDQSPSIDFPPGIFILTLLSKMSEGNFVENKIILKDQEGNNRFVNLLDHLAGLLDVLSRLHALMCTKIGILLLSLICRLLQGPCLVVQENFLVHSDILTSLNRIIRKSRVSDEDEDNEYEIQYELLREHAIDVLRAFIEGLPSDSVLLERVQTAIKSTVLNAILLPIESDDLGNPINMTELTRLQAKYLVLLKGLNDVSDIPTTVQSCFRNDIVTIEVMWNNQLHRHHYHIPDIARNLAEIHKRNVLNEIDHHTEETRYHDLIKISKDLYREGKHQKSLNSYGLIFLWSVRQLLAHVMLANIVLMNLLLTMNFTLKNDHSETHSAYVISFSSVSGSTEKDSSDPLLIYLPLEVRQTVHTLSIFEIILASLTLIIVLISRIPVSFYSYRDIGISTTMSLIYSLCTPLLLWYLFHTTVAWISLLYNPLFLSLLLVEFVTIDSATKQVMLSVINPYKQLLTTLFLFIIFLYIFATFYFHYFRDEYLDLSSRTMWNSVKIMLSYGFRGEAGIAPFMHPSISSRAIFDTLFYLIIAVFLRNIFFALIIDAFSEVRKHKMEHEIYVNTHCIICGLDQHEYDKVAKVVCEFKNHRGNIHNIWNYIYFIMKIYNQSPKQDTSLERSVRKMLKEGNVGWFPSGKIGLEERAHDFDIAEETSINGFENDGQMEQMNRRNYEEQLDVLENRITQLNNPTVSIPRGSSPLASGRSHNSISSRDETASYSEHQGTSTTYEVLDEATVQLIEQTVQMELEPLHEEFLMILEETTELLHKIEKYESTPYPRDDRNAEERSQTKSPTRFEGSSGEIKGPMLSRSVDFSSNKNRKIEQEPNILSKSTEL